jgi:hypothetical protein
MLLEICLSISVYGLKPLIGHIRLVPKTIQSGQTAYPAKIETGHELVHLTNFCKHRNRFMHKIYKKVASLVNWDTLDPDLAVYLKAYPEEKPVIRLSKEEKS